MPSADEWLHADVGDPRTFPLARRTQFAISSIPCPVATPHHDRKKSIDCSGARKSGRSKVGRSGLVFGVLPRNGCRCIDADRLHARATLWRFQTGIRLPSVTLLFAVQPAPQRSAASLLHPKDSRALAPHRGNCFRHRISMPTAADRLIDRYGPHGNCDRHQLAFLIHHVQKSGG